MAVTRRSYDLTFLPDDSLSAHTEFAFIGEGGMAFVNAAKHEQVVTRHVTEIERLRDALRIAYEALDAAFSPQLRKCNCGVHPNDVLERAVGSDLLASVLDDVASTP